MWRHSSWEADSQPADADGTAESVGQQEEAGQQGVQVCVCVLVSVRAFGVIKKTVMFIYYFLSQCAVTEYFLILVFDNFHVHLTNNGNDANMFPFLIDTTMPAHQWDLPILDYILFY